MQGERPLQFVIVLAAMPQVSQQILQSCGSFASPDFVFEEIAVVGGSQGLQLIGCMMWPCSALVESQIEFVEDVFEVHQLNTIIINQ